jgi:hypothetical protein
MASSNAVAAIARTKAPLLVLAFVLFCGCSSRSPIRGVAYPVGATHEEEVVRVRIAVQERAVATGLYADTNSFISVPRTMYSFQLEFKNRMTADQEFGSFDVYVDGRRLGRFDAPWLDLGVAAVKREANELQKEGFLLVPGRHVLELRASKGSRHLLARYEGVFDTGKDVELSSSDFELITE